MLLSLVIPVFNEESCLESSLDQVHRYLETKIPFDWELIVADNGSTDESPQIASRFSEAHPAARVLRLASKGRGRALRQAWSNSRADIFSYMDADLSSDLNTFPDLLDPLVSADYDFAVGSRVLRPGLTTRCFKREFTSRCYNVLIKLFFRPTFSDAQCGFKAITRESALNILPHVLDNGWFFDTELLLLAEKAGYRIFDLPVRWVERKESHVQVFRTAVDDVKGLIRLKRRMKDFQVRAP